MIKFAYTILYVQDVEKSIDFYERAFGFKRKFIAPGNSYGLCCNVVKVEFLPRDISVN